MDQISSCFKSYIFHLKKYKIVIKTCFILFSFFLFINGSSQSLKKEQSISYVLNPILEASIPIQYTSNFVTSHEVLLATFPNCSDIFLLNEEIVDEDFNDDFDEDFIKEIEIGFIQKDINKKISQATYSIQNQISLPFYILYHSWKIYLA